MAIDERLSYFLNSKSTVVMYETIQIKHESFTGVVNNSYWIVRNNSQGLTATLEPDAPGNGAIITFEYYPMKLSQLEVINSLDFGIKVELGEVGETLPTEIDNVLKAGKRLTKPIFRYRSFRSDDLTQPMYGPIDLEITSIEFAKESCVFDAKPTNFNRRGTGLLYKIRRIPMLRGAR